MSVSGVSQGDPNSRAIPSQNVQTGIDTSKYTAKQKNDVDKIQVDADNLAEALRTGDQGKAKSASKALKDDFKQAAKDGISKSDREKIGINVDEEVGPARLSKDLIDGKVKADDPRLAASLHNQFVRESKAQGVDPNNPNVARAYFQNLSDKLQACGVPPAQAQQVAQAAQGVPASGNNFRPPRDNRV